MRSLLVLMVSGLVLAACGTEEVAPVEKGEAQVPVVGAGKSDISESVRLKGALEIGDAGFVQSNFSEELEYHGYTLDVRDAAEVQVEVTQRGSSRGLDTTLYLFGPQNEAGNYGKSPVAFNDDDGWGLLSRVKTTLEKGGRYLIVVGTFNGSGRGNYGLKAECLGDACAPEPALEELGCVFGETYYDFKMSNEAVVIVSERVIKQGDVVSELEAAQIVEAVRRTAYDDVSTVDEAFEAVDEGLVNQSILWDASNRRAFAVYEVGAGDNSFGAFLNYDSTDVVADIVDGDIYDCSVEWGPERRLCEQNSDCATDFFCVGSAEDVPTGRCIDTRADTSPLIGESCTQDSPCAVEDGLTCAGDSWNGEGICLPSWQRGVYSAEPGLRIPDNKPEGVELEIPVYGLATVSTDVRVDMWIYHARPNDLLVTLTNPVGTVGVVFDGQAGDSELYLESHPVFGYPGDEDANGIWRLKVVDRAGGELGSLEEIRLDIMSRWD